MKKLRQSLPAPATAISADTASPAVERTLQLLMLLGDHPRGLGVPALARSTGTPRATLYRILKVLLAHGFVQPARDEGAAYQLGPAAARLGRQSPQPADLLALARPVMQALAHSVRETIKLIVPQGVEALTVAVADAGLEARVTSRVGTRMPLHIGSSQRLLLAHLPSALLREVLSHPLERRTARTFAEPERLRASLAKLKMTDSVQGHGEGLDGVGAAATLVRGEGDAILGALVAVYIHAGKTPAQLQAIGAAVEKAAQEISAWQLPAPGLTGAPI
ncbi:MAG: IclR family transcriptional regulator [Pseudomonadota bacterium]